MANKIEDKTYKILNTAFCDDVNTMRDTEAQNLIAKFINDELKTNGFDNLTYSVFVQDIKKRHWKPKDHFVKIFYDELEYATEFYSISNASVNLLFKLGRYLKWEMNLLVDDKTNTPLNQKQLAKKLFLDVKYVRNLLKELIEKNIIYNVYIGKEVFYFINPYIMFCGKNINVLIPKVFDEIGYKNSRSNRIKRHKKVTKLNEIKEN